MSLLLLLVCLNIFWRSTLSLTCKIRKGKVHLVKERAGAPQSASVVHLLAPSQRTREAGCIQLRKADENRKCGDCLTSPQYETHLGEEGGT